MDQTWFQLIFGIASLYFGVQIFRILPTFLQLLAALLSGKVKWPGPRIHDPDPHASTVRERLGVGYDNLFSIFTQNSMGVVGAFIFSIFTFISSLPQMRGYILIKSPWVYLFLTFIAMIGGRMAVEKAIRNQTQVNIILKDLGKGTEPREIEGQSTEAEYSIEHPLARRQSEWLKTTRAMNLFYESVKSRQDGNEMKALSLYQEAINADPSLHTHARDALSKLVQNSCPADQGAIYYWLGIHSEYLKDDCLAIIWYSKAIDTYQKIGYQKREARAHCNLGKVKMKLRDPSGLEEFKKAITLDPSDGIAHINIGITYYLSDDQDRALDAFAEAIWVDPERYHPAVLSFLRGYGYHWQEDMAKIGQKIAKKQGLDPETITSEESDDVRYSG